MKQLSNIPAILMEDLLTVLLNLAAGFHQYVPLSLHLLWLIELSCASPAHACVKVEYHNTWNSK